MPTLTTLFGSYSFCACDDCRSVNSPAAYLVDLLHSLNPKAGPGPIVALRKRRPDIEYLKLSCENTNTPLPYVDLVNEILEFYIANGALTVDAAYDTGNAIASELSVTPQNVIPKAYELLQGAIYPPSLPFHRPLETARMYLGRLGTTRDEVMRTFQHAGVPSDADIDLEYLNISIVERDILIGTDKHKTPEFYGYDANAVDASWLPDIVHVPQFLQRTETTYGELLELLGTRFANADGAVTLEPPDDCDLEKVDIQNLTATWLQRIHRFLRLARKLEWPVADLDLACAAFKQTDITLPFLQTLAAVERLKQELNLPLTDVVSLSTDLNSALYARLFQNKAVLNPPDTDFELNVAGDELKDTSHTFAEKQNEKGKTSALLAALRLSAADLLVLRENAGLADASATITLANLSKLYRRVVLARALKLGAAELVSLKTLSGLDPFGSPANAVEFVQLAGVVARSGFSIPLLNYVFRDVSDPAAPLAPQPAAIEALKTELQAGLTKIAEDKNDPKGELTHGFISQTLSNNLQLESTVTNVLLDQVLRSTNDPSKPAFADFAGMLDTPDTAMTTYRRLHKAAMLVNGFRISSGELSYLAAHAADFADFNLNLLPLAPGGFTPDLFKPWRRLRNLFALRDGLPQAEATVIEVFGAADAENAVSTLGKASGWDPAELKFLVSQDGLNLSTADFKNEIALVRLQRCLTLGARIGMSCQKLVEWAGAEPLDAAEVVNAAKAKYDPETWLRVAKPINDALRDRRKSALLAYLLASDDMRTRHITNTDQLFSFFLIDVEMEPCMMTSRIKQAISSVQLFVTQCLMNLEPDVSPSLIDAQRWEWMQSYRLWEANRKVFLYPENWIYPELRDDKTPCFKALETHLLQNDITAETAEDAFLGYLHDLDEVARLNIVGMYTQTIAENSSSSTIVHVVGRTHAAPFRHFYRRQADGVWSAWEKIDVDIESEHVIPVVYDRRLYLFWPHFEERPDEKQQLPGPYIQSLEHWKWQFAHEAWQQAHAAWASAPQDPPAPEPKEPDEPTYSAPLPPLKHQEIKLCWSEYRSGGWSAKQTSTAFVTSPYVTQRLSDFVSSTFYLEADNQRNFNATQVFTLQSAEGGWNMIVDVCVPEPNQHFFRTQIEPEDLLIEVCRRERHTYSILNLYPVVGGTGYQTVGYFRLGCGMKVSAESHVPPALLYPYPMPDDTTNDAMAFRHQGSVRTLSLSGKDTIDVLDFYPPDVGQYSVLPEHQFSVFSLPTQNFFYQDDRRAYFAHYQPEPLGIVLAKQDALTMTAVLVPDHELVSAVKAKASAPSSAAASAVPLEETMPAAAEGPGGVTEHSDAMHASFIKFDTFYHPFVCEFLKQLHRKGVPGLFAPPPGQGAAAGDERVQALDNDALATINMFSASYKPQSIVSPVYPRENVDFDGGAYSIYNWELFFHAPMLVATALANNQKFDEARTWFHYIFNPTNAVQQTPKGYWNTLPFYNNDATKDRIQDLLDALHNAKPLPDELKQQIEAWIHDPFNPHHIARLRITAYQKNVVMKYIDVLLQYGDLLFNRNTIEAINEATLMYLLAHSLLGPRPEPIPPHQKIAAMTYADLKDLDEFSNAMVPFENEMPYLPQNPSPDAKLSDGQSGPTTFYFCVPPNTDLLRYWDTVEDRLFKIRHCMNIEGQVQALPLFEPPIDPGLLVRAKAAGLDLTSVLADISAPLPAYRFTYMLQKALELCGDLKSLGGALLAALEKQDAEALSSLRAAHETALFKAVRDVRTQQIAEANEALEGLRRSKVTVEARHDYYSALVTAGVNAHEQEHMDQLGTALVFNQVSQGLMAGVSGAHMIPDFHDGVAGFSSPFIVAKWGGNNLGNALQASSSIVAMVAAIHSHQATMASIKGGYDRRADEWAHQQTLAEKELSQIDKQIAAAEIRAAIAQSEADNQDLQIEHSQAVESFLRGKYTNADLYGWMTGQISKVYFQVYKLAYGLGKRTERCCQFEGVLPSSNYVQFGYWDNLKKGLLAGEQLALDLKRLEAAYLEQNTRVLEITRQISLAAVDPHALLTLKETGTCDVEFVEPFFDMDYPGHYMRRIKSVSVTIPCVVGPYTSVNATLRRGDNKVRFDSTSQLPYKALPAPDQRFSYYAADSSQSIAVSHAQNDAGLFELNFRDERYLPFEGTGAIGTWRFELSSAFKAFDFDTISDVIFHLRYTARDGGNLLKGAAIKATNDWLAGQKDVPLARLFSARHEFPNDWYRFLNPLDETADHQMLMLDLGADRFPFPFRAPAAIAMSELQFYLKLKPGAAYNDAGPLKLRFDFGKQGGGSYPANELSMNPDLMLPWVAKPVAETPGVWSIAFKEADLKAVTEDLKPSSISLKRVVTVDKVDHVRLNPDAIDDLWILCRYTVKT